MVKCDLCDQEFANSEEVKGHKEQAHPMGDDSAKAELGGGMKQDESEMPEPAEKSNR